MIYFCVFFFLKQQVDVMYYKFCFLLNLRFFFYENFNFTLKAGVFTLAAFLNYCKMHLQSVEINVLYSVHIASSTTKFNYKNMQFKNHILLRLHIVFPYPVNCPSNSCKDKQLQNLFKIPWPFFVSNKIVFRQMFNAS